MCFCTWYMSIHAHPCFALRVWYNFATLIISYLFSFCADSTYFVMYFYNPSPLDFFQYMILYSQQINTKGAYICLVFQIIVTQWILNMFLTGTEQSVMSTPSLSDSWGEALMRFHYSRNFPIFFHNNSYNKKSGDLTAGFFIAYFGLHKTCNWQIVLHALVCIEPVSCRFGWWQLFYFL